jgi:DNA-binding LacI/PurR family transcriptional regulator
VNVDDDSAETRPGARTRALGLVYPPSGDSYTYTAMQLDFVGKLFQAVQVYDYDLLLTNGSEVGDRPFQRLVEGNLVDGVILMEIRLVDTRVGYLTEMGVPFVTIGRTGSEETWWVDADYASVARDCVRHLADLGHRRIAFVNRPERLFESGYESAHRGLAGFEEGMAELGRTGHTYLCDDDAAAGEACLEQILRDDPATTALVTPNEAALPGLYLGLRRAGRAVPRDFSVAGLAAEIWAETVTPPLTAAAVPVDEMSRIGVELMMRRLDAPGSAPRHVLLNSPLTPRSSTGPCRRMPGTDG